MNQIAPDRATLDRLLAEARRLIKRRAPREALPLLRAAALVPNAPASVFGLLAEAQLLRGEGQAALVAVETALAEHEEDLRLRLLRAEARRQTGDLDGAMDDAAFAVMAQPRDPEARLLLATCLSEASRHDEALFLFWQVLQEAPERRDARLGLALALSRAGRHHAAEEVYAFAQQGLGEALGVGAPRSRNMLAAGDAEAALAIAEEALAREGPTAALEAVRGQALMQLGRTGEARSALEAAARLSPGDGFVSHLASILAGEAGGASRAYLRELFDGYASHFEPSLISLGYRGPGLLLRALETVRPGLANGTERLGDVLDLGCGTGLAGVAVHDLLAGRLVGVDLSPGMLRHAQEKGIYTALHKAEITDYLLENSECFEVIMAADVFVYLGDLRPVLRAAAARLGAGGHLAFTCEAAAEGRGVIVTPQGRFQHDESHLNAALTGAGLTTRILRREDIRLEGGRPVPGWLVLAERAH